VSTGLTERAGGNAGIVWAAAAAVAGLGTWIIYDALPGVNWPFWTLASVTGLAAILRTFGLGVHRIPAAAATTGVIIATAAAFTADPFMHAMIFLAVTLLLSVTMLLAVDPRLERISAAFVITAPFLAGARAIVESLARAIDASRIVRSNRARSALKGLAITAPVILFFALLLAGADPMFAEWRDAAERILSSWAFVPRTIFFVALLSIVLGTYGFAARGNSSQSDAAMTVAPKGPESVTRWLGATERFILLSSVAALFWIFLAVQVSYLFGNSPATAGSGVTFAEYARRGFGELTVVATSTVLLILLSERYGQKGHRDGLLRAITLAVIAAVLILLGSAFHRVSLYEAAYGFTTARLYAQVYMLVVAVTLAVLTLEIRREMQSARVFRRSAAAALAAFVVMIYWNHEAWIARENIARFSTTGKLDVVYLTRQLSPNAIPAIVAALPTLPEPIRSQLRSEVRLRYEYSQQLIERHWFEWNRGRSAARNALIRIGVATGQRRPPPRTPIVVR